MILVAGGRGFIGSKLCSLFESHDIAYDVSDLKDGTGIGQYPIDGSKYDVIVLLAANLNHDDEMYRHNLAIYEWAIKQTAHIIYTSSAAVYADNTERHTEDDPTPAPTWYGKSKLLGETMIKEHLSNYTILRLANVYGNGDGNGAIDIFKRGGRYIYGTGDDVRDYVSVRVVTEALKDIALNPEPYNRQTYNISSGEPLTTKQAFYKYGQGLPEYLEPRGFDVKYSVLDNTKAKQAGLICELPQL